MTNTQKKAVVKKGLVMRDRDNRTVNYRFIQIDRVSRIAGVAFVHNTSTGKKSAIRLDRLVARFEPRVQMSASI